jgi:hypothetical protein
MTHLDVADHVCFSSRAVRTGQLERTYYGFGMLSNMLA